MNKREKEKKKVIGYLALLIIILGYLFPLYLLDVIYLPLIAQAEPFLSE
jgi:hypothetical protein